MASASKETTTVVTLTLDVEESGYLLNLLTAHVGGRLTIGSQPLGRISAVLEDAGVEGIRAYNANGSGVYAALYRSHDDAVG
jgi:hypothetical protein